MLGKKHLLLAIITLSTFATLSGCAASLEEELQQTKAQRESSDDFFSLIGKVKELNRCPKGGYHENVYIGSEPILKGRFLKKHYKCKKCGYRSSQRTHDPLY